MKKHLSVVSLVVAVCAGCGRDEPAAPLPVAPPRPQAGSVDDARLRAAAGEPSTWLAHGRTWSRAALQPARRASRDEQRRRLLQRRWSVGDGDDRGASRPRLLMIDGVLYFDH